MLKRKRTTGTVAAKKLAKLDHCKQLVGSNEGLHHGALLVVYSKVQSLRSYLLSSLPHSSRTRRKRIANFDIERPEQAGFLDRTLVGVLHDSSKEVLQIRLRELHAYKQETQLSTTNNRSGSPQCNIQEVLEFVIWHLFQRSQNQSRRPDHLLCHGFDRTFSIRPSKDHDETTILPGILKRWTNPNVEAFSTPPWSDALSLCGNDIETIAVSLFIDCGIFIPLGSGDNNLFQLSGQPVFNISRSRHTGMLVKCDSTAHVRPPQAGVDEARRPGQVTFVRNRMFYARASINCHGSARLGLKHIHVLNRYGKLEPKIQQLRLLQYVFPRQFGLHNVFTSHVNPSETTQPFKDYTVRDDELEQYHRRNGDKVPRRLRGQINQLICRLKINHQRCSYTQLLYHYTSRPQSQKAVNNQVDQNGKADDRDGLETRIGRSFHTHATPQGDVSAFCRAVLRNLIPYQAFGTRENGANNWTKLFAMVDKFITLRRFETFSLHEIVQYIKITSLDWLRPANVHTTHKLSQSDRAKRFELLHEFVYFIFDSILIPLIRSTFYVTETSMQRNQLSYFRHDIWRKISEPSLMTLRLKMFEPLNARQLRYALQNHTLGSSQVRLLPKENGARPITNLRRKAKVSFNGNQSLGPSINTKLTSTFSVLNFERERQPETVASALFSISEIGRKLKDFRARHAAAGGCQQALYFVKMDIKSCFDTIPQQQLLSLVKTLLKESEYRVTRHVENKRLAHSGKNGKDQLSSRFVSRASEQATSPAFSAAEAECLARKKRGIMFAGTDSNRSVRLTEIHQLLEDHISNNIVRIGRRHFRQIEGIPQGSVLSSLLCSFFYAEFEHQKLDFLEEQSSVLLRLIDDFLLITTDRRQAQMFVDAMSDGYGEYGIDVHAAKSLVNFEASVGGHQIPRIHGTEYFPYCGLGVHMKTLELSRDRQRKGLHVQNALTVDISGRAVMSLQRRILTALKLQMHGMLLDASHNSSVQIMTTLFECYVEATMKLHQYRVSLPRSKRPGSKFLISLGQQMLSAGHMLFTRLPSSAHPSCRHVSVFWIGSVAMMAVLSRKQTEYEGVLHWLQMVELGVRRSQPQVTRGLDHIVRGGLAAFRGYVY